MEHPPHQGLGWEHPLPESFLTFIATLQSRHSPLFAIPKSKKHPHKQKILLNYFGGKT